MVFHAFGIASIIFSVIAFFIPVFGIMISGLSGILAWASAGKATHLGGAAVIINLANIFLFSPVYILAMGIEESIRSQEETRLFTIWLIVLFIQISAIAIFIINLFIDKIIPILISKSKKSRHIVGAYEKVVKNAPFIKINDADTSNDLNVSKVTKVLIHKIHGGRKKDSKFWNDKVDIKQNSLVNIPIETQRENILSSQKKKYFLFSTYAVISFIAILYIFILIKPELFHFLKYNDIYSAVSNQLPSRKEYYPTERYKLNSQTKKHKTKKYESPPEVKHEKIYLKNIVKPSISKQETISLSGNIFSWRDKNGKFHFSNTNYPIDNETLKVQTEINSYHNVTKIKIRNNQIFVPVTLQNKGRKTTLNMLLDTGCSHTVVPYKTLSYLNARYGNKFTVTLADGSKSVGRKAFIDSMEVGSRRSINVIISGAKVAGSRNTGLLGMDFLKYNTFRIDFDNKFLVWM